MFPFQRMTQREESHVACLLSVNMFLSFYTPHGFISSRGYTSSLTSEYIASSVCRLSHLNWQIWRRESCSRGLPQGPASSPLWIIPQFFFELEGKIVSNRDWSFPHWFQTAWLQYLPHYYFICWGSNRAKGRIKCDEVVDKYWKGWFYCQ